MQYEQPGTSCFGRSISMLAGGCGTRHVLFCAAHHGSKWITACVLRRFLAEFAVQRDWRQMVHLYAVPCANPDGAALSMGIPRRFGYRLASVSSESAYADYKDWFIQEYRRPAHTVACGYGENPLSPSQLDGIYTSVRPILETALCGIP